MQNKFSSAKRVTQIFVLLFFVFGIKKTEAQIYFTNPSFEDSSQCLGCLVQSWHKCENTPDVWQNIYNLNAYDGIFAIGVLSSFGTYFESVSQKLNCNLLRDKSTYFSANLATFIDATHPNKGQIEIWGGLDTCDLNELLWVSPILDTVWNKFEIQFTPSKNFTWLILRSHWSGIWPGAYAMIDNLSSIKVSDNTSVKINNDTSIEIGDAINLSAITNVNYQSAKWTSIPSGFHHTGLNAGWVHPDSTTKYIIELKICDSCCYYSYDTVNVIVFKRPLPPRDTCIIIPTTIYTSANPVFTIQKINGTAYASIYDLTGRQLFSTHDYKNDFSFANLPDGIYIAKLQGCAQDVITKVVWCK